MISVYVSLESVPHGEQRRHAHGLLTECLAAAGAEYAFEKTPLILGEQGKPSLAERPDIFYNLSHAEGVCACFANRDECGIDCECVREYRPRVARKVFSADELAALEAAAEGERDMLFFRIWTLKEAFVKAIGRGIGYPMNTVSFVFSGDEISSNAAGWRFAQFIINETAVVSVCTKEKIRQKQTKIETQNKRLILNIKKENAK